MKEEKKQNSRRDFLKTGLIAGAGALAGGSLLSACNSENSGEKVKLLTTDGKLVDVDKSQISMAPASKEASKQGLPGKKFVMVIDLAKCKNARACVTACQEGHHLPSQYEYMKVYLLQDDENTSAYWFPKPCFHCDNPLCVSVCPVGATYKRTDGIVLVDHDRCIGCKFCMTGCPYSTRIFSWNHNKEFDSPITYSPETTYPGKEGTVSKCVFCADRLREGKLPYCVEACPMGVIYFGDINEDAVTNGSETVKFSELIRDKAGFRFLEELGLRPNVYYLPAVNRQFPLDRGFDGLDENIEKRYKGTLYYKQKIANDE